VLAFDRMRRKGHLAVYDMAGTISKEEAENAVSRAEAFLDAIGGPSPLRVFGFTFHEGEICRPAGLSSPGSDPEKRCTLCIDLVPEVVVEFADSDLKEFL
jgi:hypothetical protein